MGASCWVYLVPYQPDLEAAFAELQDWLLASGEFRWRFSAPRPATRAELAAAKAHTDFGAGGTHTVLDMDRVVGSFEDEEFEDGAIRPLSPEEVPDYFETDRPAEADFSRARDLLGGLFWDGMDRWTGRCTVLYGPGGEQQIVFFGVSGD